MKPLARICLTGGAGLLAGMAAGILETGLLALLGGSTGHLHALLWAVVVYGLLGLVGGLCLGFLLVLRRRSGSGSVSQSRTVALAFATVFCALALFVVRYRLYRDLFDESIRTFSLQGLLFNGGLLLGFLALCFGLIRLLSRPALRRIASMSGSLAGCAILLVLAGAVTLLARPTSSRTVAPAGIPPGLESAPNVILIGVDTLRSDRLSCYGYTVLQTPHIDALAAGGVRYADMTAQASWTKPSFATVLTSLYPSSHTAIGKLDRLPQAVTTLAEALAAGGYHTGGIVDNVSIGPAFGFEQGFADFAYLSPSYLFGAGESASQLGLYQGLRRVWARVTGGRIYVQNFYQDASVVNREAMQWLTANKGTRFFLFLHYMDPHDPYFEHPYNGHGYARASNQNPDPALAPTFSQLYDGEVRYLDDYLGALFDWLKTEKLYDDALIVLTADHGEEFQEHGGWWHGQTLYQEQIAVPLIVKYPGGARAGTVVTELARSLDVAPTVLDAAGLPMPDTMLGRSLWSASEPPVSVFAEEDLEGNRIYAVRTWEFKLIRANADNPRGLPAESLYRLAGDPGEQHPLDPSADAQTVPIERLRTLLRDALAEALSRAVAGEAGDLDAAVRQKLRDLGY
jgi:arylsulfatase A-like enzyme